MLEGCNLRAIKSLFLLAMRGRTDAEFRAVEDDLRFTYVPQCSPPLWYMD